jgi:hypothetical protein
MSFIRDRSDTSSAGVSNSAAASDGVPLANQKHRCARRQGGALRAGNGGGP